MADAVKTVPLTVAALCVAVLFGLAPPRAVAGDPAPGPSSASAVASDSAATAQGASSERSSAAQTRPAGQSAASGKDATAAQDAAVGRNDSAAGHAASRSGGASKPAGRPLDLTTPPVSHVMTREQVAALTAQPDEDDSEEVMVEQERYQAPVPRGQIRALAWALMHPLSAWRIFTPVTDQ